MPWAVIGPDCAPFCEPLVPSVAAYVALAWLVVQVLDTLAPMFGLGEATARLGRHAEAIDLLEAHIDPPREFGPLGMRQDPL